MSKEEKPSDILNEQFIPLPEEDVIEKKRKQIDLDIERSIQQRATVGIKPSFPYHYIIMVLIAAHFLVMLYIIDDVRQQIDQLSYKIDSFKTPVHNGISSVVFKQDKKNISKTIMLTTFNDRAHVLIPLPLTSDSATVEIREEESDFVYEKKVKVTR